MLGFPGVMCHSNLDIHPSPQFLRKKIKHQTFEPHHAWPSLHVIFEGKCKYQSCMPGTWKWWIERYLGICSFFKSHLISSFQRISELKNGKKKHVVLPVAAKILLALYYWDLFVVFSTEHGQNVPKVTMLKQHQCSTSKQLICNPLEKLMCAETCSFLLTTQLVTTYKKCLGKVIWHDFMI